MSSEEEILNIIRKAIDSGKYKRKKFHLKINFWDDGTSMCILWGDGCWVSIGTSDDVCNFISHLFDLVECERTETEIKYGERAMRSRDSYTLNTIYDRLL